VVESSARGRVNLIGDHTDYTGGLVLPMVLDCRTTIEGDYTTDGRWHLESADEPEPTRFAIPDVDLTELRPRWGRYVAAVVREMHALGIPVRGFRGRVTTTIPIGSGLSSSAALEVAVARLVLAGDSIHLSDSEVAQLCRRAEHSASGVPCGIMDQLCIVAGRPGHATLIDCHSLDITHIELPDHLEVVVEFIAPRTLAGSEYADRVDETRRAEQTIGPLRTATIAEVEAIDDPLIRRRARHVVSENARVRDFVSALTAGDDAEVGRLMVESHRSLAVDFGTSTPAMDAAVDRLMATPGVIGARMTGGGFGGCVVALRRR